MKRENRNWTPLAFVALILALAAGPVMAQDYSAAKPSTKGNPYEALPFAGGLDILSAPGAAKSAHDCTLNPDNLLVNCSFEYGFDGWNAVDMADPLSPLGVFPNGAPVGWEEPFVFSLILGPFPVISTPTQGDFVAGHGFDGGGPDSIVISQSVNITGGDCELVFDYRAGWDTTFFATQPRLFNVSLGDFSQNLLTAQPAWVADTLVGNLGVDFPGSASTVVAIPGCGTTAGPADLIFEWFIPENFTGPAAFMMDNVQLVCDPTPSNCGNVVTDIATQIDGLNLDPALEEDLLDTVANALDKLEKGNIAAAIAQLRTLLGEIEQALLDGDISAADASALFASIIDVLAALS